LENLNKKIKTRMVSEEIPDTLLVKKSFYGRKIDPSPPERCPPLVDLGRRVIVVCMRV